MANITTTSNQNNMDSDPVIVNRKNQLRAIKKSFFPEGFTDDRFEDFINLCVHYGLDPALNQIYALKRNKREGNGYVTVLTTYISIEGCRILARRSGKYAGQEMTEYCGEDGQWMQIWTKNTPPVACRVAVYHKDCDKPYYGVSYANELVDSNPINKTHLLRMMEKTAEMSALKRAFPNDIQHATNPDDEHPRYVDVEEILEDNPQPIHKPQKRELLKPQPTPSQPATTTAIAPAEPELETEDSEPIPTNTTTTAPTTDTSPDYKRDTPMITEAQFDEISDLLQNELIPESDRNVTLKNLHGFTYDRAEICIDRLRKEIERKAKNASRDSPTNEVKKGLQRKPNSASSEETHPDI